MSAPNPCVGVVRKWVGVDGSVSVGATVCGCAVLLVISLFQVVPHCS